MCNLCILLYYCIVYYISFKPNQYKKMMFFWPINVKKNANRETFIFNLKILSLMKFLRSLRTVINLHFKKNVRFQLFELKKIIGVQSMDNTSKLDKIIEHLFSINPLPVSLADAEWLCNKIRPMLLIEPTLLEISGPLHVVGDIHGQINDLVHIFKAVGLPPYAKWLFLGDYVDRGKYSVEVICLLFALKIKYPYQIYLIRGNHETRDMTEIFGFEKECREKLSHTIWPLFCTTFDALPLAAVINNTIFCVHGGISPDLFSIHQIREIDRPFDIPQNGMITDLLWSDPNPNVEEYGQSSRGSTVTWGLGPVKKFMQNNKLTMVVRGHQVALNGFDYPFYPNKSIVTLFSASNYDITCRNKAAYMVVDKDGKTSFRTPNYFNMAMTMPLPLPKRVSTSPDALPTFTQNSRLASKYKYTEDAMSKSPRNNMQKKRSRSNSLSLTDPIGRDYSSPSMLANTTTSCYSPPVKKRALRTQSALMSRRNGLRNSLS